MFNLVSVLSAHIPIIIDGLRGIRVEGEAILVSNFLMHEMYIARKVLVGLRSLHERIIKGRKSIINRFV